MDSHRLELPRLIELSKGFTRTTLKVKSAMNVFMKMTAAYESEQKQLSERVTELKFFLSKAKEENLNAQYFLSLVKNICRNHRIEC
jgi:hypothetical protein